MRASAAGRQRDRGRARADFRFLVHSIPSSSRASSLIFDGSHGGSQTSFTSASRMPGTDRTRSSTSLRQRFRDRAMRRGQGHRDDRVAVLADVDVVDQAELVDVDRDFGVVDRLQRLDDRRLQIAVRRRLRLFVASRRRGSRRDSRACARTRRHAGARRRGRPPRPPRSRSCVPRSSEKSASPARCRAPAPRCPSCRCAPRSSPARSPPRRASSISGCAQWWPARIATPASSNMVAMSCGCTPSTLKLTIPALSSGPYSVTPGCSTARRGSRRPARIRARGSRRGRASRPSRPPRAARPRRRCAACRLRTAPADRGRSSPRT